MAAHRMLFAIAMSIGCSTRGPDPRILSVTPAEGPQHLDTPIEIEAADLQLALAVDYSDPSHSSIDPNLRLLLGETEISPRLIARGRLQATVPAGLQIGSYRLTVFDGAGRAASLEDAFVVRAPTCTELGTPCAPPLLGGDDLTATVDDTPIVDLQATDPGNHPPTAGVVAIAAFSGQAISIDLPGGDPDGDALTFRVTSGPEAGVLSPLTGPMPTILYQPPPIDQLASGDIHFTYVVNDGTLDSAEGSVTIALRPRWWDPGWMSRRAIMVDQTTGTFSDFAVLMRLDASRIDYARTSSNGVDLRFIADDQTTVLAHQIESWDPNGESFIWVSLPEVRTNARFWMYYQNPAAANGEAPALVWNNEYDGVWHLGADFADSTAAQNTGFGSGTVRSTGAVGQGRSFDGNDFIDLPPLLVSTSAGTIMFWARSPGNNFGYGVDHSIAVYATNSIDPNADGVGDDYELHLGFDPEPAGVLFFFFIEGGVAAADDVRIWSAQDENDGQWHLVVATWDRPAGYARLYVDGVLSGEDVHTAFNFDNAFTRLGRPSGAVRAFQGRMDELRILGIPQDADWVTAHHRSMTDTLLTYLPPGI